MIRTKKRTYGSKREEYGPITHKDILRSVPNSSTLFDALSSNNIKKYRKENSYLYPTNRSSLTVGRKRKIIKKPAAVINLESVQPSIDSSSDASLHVKHNSIDIFDKLKLSLVENDDPFQKLLLEGGSNLHTKLPARLNMTTDSSSCSPVKESVLQTFEPSLKIPEKKKKKKTKTKKKPIIFQSKSTNDHSQSINNHELIIENEKKKQNIFSQQFLNIKNIPGLLGKENIDNFRELSLKKFDHTKDLQQKSFTDLQLYSPIINKNALRQVCSDSKTPHKKIVPHSSTPYGKLKEPFCIQGNDLSAISKSENSLEEHENNSNISNVLVKLEEEFPSVPVVMEDIMGGDQKTNMKSLSKSSDGNKFNHVEVNNLMNEEEEAVEKEQLKPIINDQEFTPLKGSSTTFGNSRGDSVFLGFPPESKVNESESLFFGFSSPENSRKCSPILFDSSGDLFSKSHNKPYHLSDKLAEVSEGNNVSPEKVNGPITQKSENDDENLSADDKICSLAYSKLHAENSSFLYDSKQCVNDKQSSDSADYSLLNDSKLAKVPIVVLSQLNPSCYKFANRFSNEFLTSDSSSEESRIASWTRNSKSTCRGKTYDSSSCSYDSNHDIVGSKSSDSTDYNLMNDSKLAKVPIVILNRLNPHCYNKFNINIPGDENKLFSSDSTSSSEEPEDNLNIEKNLEPTHGNNSKTIIKSKNLSKLSYDSSESQLADISNESSDFKVKEDLNDKFRLSKSFTMKIVDSPIVLRNKKTVYRINSNRYKKQKRKTLKSISFEKNKSTTNSKNGKADVADDRKMELGEIKTFNSNHLRRDENLPCTSNERHDSLVKSAAINPFVTERRIAATSHKYNMLDNSTYLNVTQNSPNSTIDRVARVTNHLEDLTEKSSYITSNKRETFYNNEEFCTRPSIVLEPGKRWERSLHILRNMNRSNTTFDNTLDSCNMTIQQNLHPKGRKYRESVAHLLNLQTREGRRNSYADYSKAFHDTLSTTQIHSVTIVQESTLRPNDVSQTSHYSEEELLSDACNDTAINLSRLAISKATRNSGLLDDDHSESDWSALNARDVVLRRCNQTHPLPFDECYPDKKLQKCCKIGEGVYGEVFLYKNEDDPANPIVMKVIPIEGNQLVNGDHQKKFEEIISEVVIAMELSDLRNNEDNCTFGFNKVNRVRCVKGRYPPRLIELWELYDESKGSENDCPTLFDAGQLYIVLELANGGKDLEAFKFVNAEQSYNLFFQIAFALAVAEETFQFEHRDLHWGNVLITLTDKTSVECKLRGESFSIPTSGVLASIIDYTLSRITLPSAGQTIYNNLAKDPDLFNAHGGDYQFDIYRLMRQKNGNLWQHFEPYTNILWLHYILDKMITALRYERTDTCVHTIFIAKLQYLKKKILQYDSCIDFVTTEECCSISDI